MATGSTSITLNPKQTYVDKTSGLVITGTDGSETVSVLAKVVNSSITNVGTIKLPGKLADYTTSVTSDALVISFSGGSGEPVAVVTPTGNGTRLVFSDGNKAVVSLDQGSVRFHVDVIQMAAKGTVSLTDGNVSVLGSSGTETLNINPGLANISVDAKVDKVNISADLDAITLTGAKGSLSLSTSDGTKIADLAVAKGHTEILSFNDASGTLTVDSAGKGAFNLTSISLSAGDTYTVTASGVTISAATPGDTTMVILGTGATKEHITSAIGQVKLAGLFSDYLYQSKTGVLYVYDKANHLVADIQVQHDSNGTGLVFSGDGSMLPATFTTSGGINIGVAAVSSTKASAITLPAPQAPAVTGGTSTFEYSLTLGDFGQYRDAIKTDMTAALNNIGKYLNAKGVMNIQVLPETIQSGVIADASGAITSTPSSLLSYEHGAGAITAFQLTSLTGTDPNPGGFDATVHINMANILRENLNPNVGPNANQIDLTTALTHELFHAIGFEGFLGTSQASKNKTVFDTYVTMKNGKPYFTGTNAEAVYGGPVPLAPASAGSGSAYYHVDVANDLMATSLSNGQIRTISALDLAILRDLGIAEVVTVGTPASVLHG
ncbi:MAG: hypothetical protein NT159_12400 [Proteobacteria bacterium]|nr:hypothetical protein [Pseudomonadota bacterium]